MAFKLDHVVIHVSDWARSNAFYRDVFDAEIVPRGAGFAYKIGDIRLNCHGPGIGHVNAVAKVPVMPGNSDICFEWEGPIEGAADRLKALGIDVELGPVATNGVLGPAISVYFRDPDGSLLEFLSYHKA